MAAQTMRPPHLVSEHVAQYRLVACLLRGAYSPDTAGEVLAFLLCRDEPLEVDHAVAAAWADAPEPWAQRVQRWAAQSGFVSSLR